MISSKSALAIAVTALLCAAGCHHDDDDDADRRAADTTMPAPAPSPGMPGTDTIAPAGSTMAPYASATDNAVPAPATFDQMDQNHDGSVTSDELHGDDALKQHFSEADSNGDGKLSADEINQYRAGSPASMPMASPSS